MKFLFVVYLFMLGVSSVAAYQINLTEVTEPYEIVPILSEIEMKQAYLGELEDFPIMYEVEVATTTALSAQLTQLHQGDAEPLGFGLMIVQKDELDGGVTEIGRLSPGEATWTVRKDSVYGMSFWDSEIITKELLPGVYRIEVSTPDNLGRYLLTLGEKEQPLGYFETLSHVRTIQKGFGLSPVRMLASSYLYYPLGVILLLFVMQRTWRFRKSIANVD